jgi:hypothetical protein
MHLDFDINPYLLTALRILMDDFSGWIDDEESHLLVDQHIGQFHQIQPRYTCPTCHAEINSKPNQVPLLQTVLEFLPADIDVEVMGPMGVDDKELPFDKFLMVGWMYGEKDLQMLYTSVMSILCR